MNVLNVERVTKGYGNRTLFEDITLGINEGDKIGVIGVNGTGKSTFLKIIAGLVTPDAGQVVCKNGIHVSYLSQNPVFEKDDTVLSYVCRDKKALQNRNVEAEAKTILNKLGITDYGQRTAELSGGQRKRAALARTLLLPSEILVLDEPTNHLDNDMVIWLEYFLDKFKGQLVMVTHDRYFLDRVTNRIVELDRGSLYSYDVNYSGFLERKAQREEMLASTEKKRQNILRTELEWVRRGCQARSTKQQARLDRYEDMKAASRAARASLEKQTLEMSSVSTRVGKKTIEINHVSKSYGQKKLFCDFSHIVLRDERIGIVGPNGCGKSTLLKVITGKTAPDAGSVEMGETIRIGCFMQENEFEDETLRVIDYVKNIGEYVTTVDGKITAGRMCERFLFTPDAQYTPIAKLSGGEKRRLYLLGILMESPNVLILDEPTNDLDIETLTILEDYIDNFVGMVIVVSHDRYFLDRVADRIFAFEGDGVITQYEGGFSDYLEKAFAKGVVDRFGTLTGGAVREKDAGGGAGSKNQWKEDKKNNKVLKFSYTERKEFDTIEDDIEQIEIKLRQTDEEILKNATNSGRLNELMNERNALEETLNVKMERWLYLNELAEQIQYRK